MSVPALINPFAVLVQYCTNQMLCPNIYETIFTYAPIAGFSIFAHIAAGSGADRPNIDVSTQGPSLLISSRGGSVNYSSTYWQASILFRCFASDVKIAEHMSLAIMADLDQKAYGNLFKMANIETFPQIVPDDQDTKWKIGFSYYQIPIRVR